MRVQSKWLNMKNKVKVLIAKSYRLLNYGPVVLLSSAEGDKSNIASIAWSAPLSSDPVLVGVAIHEEHYTTQLISQSKEYVINIPSADLINQVQKCGSVHGFNIDKFEKFKLTPLAASKVKVPLIKECIGHLECRVVKTVKLGDHFLFVGKVVAALADKGVLSIQGILNLKKVKSLHHLGGDEFGTLQEV